MLFSKIKKNQTSELSYLKIVLLTQENPMQPIASESMSPRIEGYELPAGKYA